MAGYFQMGEEKIRPGAYFHVDKKGEENAFGAVDRSEERRVGKECY